MGSDGWAACSSGCITSVSSHPVSPLLSIIELSSRPVALKYMVVSEKKETPKYYSTFNRDPQYGSPNFGKPPNRGEAWLPFLEASVSLTHYTLNPGPQTLNLNLQILNPKPQTLNPKPQTLNLDQPKPYILNLAAPAAKL